MASVSPVSAACSSGDTAPPLVFGALGAGEKAPAGLLALLRRIVPRLDAQLWTWECRAGPLGPALVHYASIGGRPVAHLALLPVPFRVGRKVVRGAKGEGAIADLRLIAAQVSGPNRRVYRELTDRLTAEVSASGIEMIYGFPNRHAYNAHIRAGCKGVLLPVTNARAVWSLRHGRVGRSPAAAAADSVCDLLWRPCFGAIYRMVAKLHPNIRRLDDADAQAVDAFCLRWARQNPGIVSVERTWPYLRWRVLNNPYGPGEVYGLFGTAGRLVGMIAVSGPRDPQAPIGEIQDIAALSSSRYVDLLRWAVAWARARKLAALDVWTMPTDRHRDLNRALRRCGFIHRRPRQAKKAIVFAPDHSVACDPGNWFIGKVLNRC